jgi:hypothetical protein
MEKRATSIKQRRRQSEATMSRPLITKNKMPQSIVSVAPRRIRALPKISIQDSMHKRYSTASCSELTKQIQRARTSTLPALSTIEPVVRASSPLPPDYNFLPKGNPYMTRHCRQKTRLAHQTVYAVVNDEKKQVGIRVPSTIYEEVLQSENASRESRQQMVEKHDKSVEEQFKEASE